MKYMGILMIIAGIVLTISGIEYKGIPIIPPSWGYIISGLLLIMAGFFGLKDVIPEIYKRLKI